jgi:hypothetical protein
MERIYKIETEKIGKQILTIKKIFFNLERAKLKLRLEIGQPDILKKAYIRWQLRYLASIDKLDEMNKQIKISTARERF